MNERVGVSVIIPLKDDAPRLRICLEALDRQVVSGRFEVVVVDNGSELSPEHVVEQFPFARLVAEPQFGSYAARNAGVLAAKGDILAFTDADCIPAPDWLARGAAALTAAGAMAFVGGSVRLFARDEGRPTPTEIFELVSGFPQEAYITSGYSVTANLFVSRADFLRTGMFAEELMSSGDAEWGRRASATGLHGVFAEDVRVDHPARRHRSELHRKIRRLETGYGQVRLRQGVPLRGGHVLRAFVPPFRSVVRGLRKVRPPTARNRAAFVAMALWVDMIHATEGLRVAVRGPRIDPPRLERHPPTRRRRWTPRRPDAMPNGLDYPPRCGGRSGTQTHVPGSTAHRRT